MSTFYNKKGKEKSRRPFFRKDAFRKPPLYTWQLSGSTQLIARSTPRLWPHVGVSSHGSRLQRAPALGRRVRERRPPCIAHVASMRPCPMPTWLRDGREEEGGWAGAHSNYSESDGRRRKLRTTRSTARTRTMSRTCWSSQSTEPLTTLSMTHGCCWRLFRGTPPRDSGCAGHCHSNGDVTHIRTYFTSAPAVAVSKT